MSSVAAGSSRPVRAPGTPPGRSHLDAVDAVRVVMIAGVIAVHLVGFTTNNLTDPLAGFVSDVLHINREVFFVLTAFVLTYAYGLRTGWSLGRFWAKRYLLVGVPYVVWTVLYYFANHSPEHPLSLVVHRFGFEFLTGTARYHLYFLLVTMQIYAVFPLLLGLLRAARRHHWLLLGAGLAAQIAITSIYHYRIPIPHALSFWFNHLDAWLISYPFYVIAGGIAALHFEEVTAWVRTRGRLVRRLVASGLAVTLASYLFDQLVLGMNPAQAGEVFQPVVAVTASAAIMGLYALGVHWADRGPDRPGRRAVRVTSDATFGVYLSHPLLLQGLFATMTPLIRAAGAGRIPSALVIPVDLLVVVPAFLAVNTALVALVRRTPASLPLTGRPRMPMTQRAGQEPPVRDRPAPANG